MIKVTDFDLRLLRIFKTVSDCGGFSAAEATLDMNLSTISTHMADLEARLGIRLCERGRKGFRLTDEGRAFYSSVQRLLDSVEVFRMDVGALHRQISGELLIGIVDNTITDKQSPVSHAIGQLKRQSRDLEIRLEVKSPSEIEDGVLHGKLHLGIVPTRIAQAGLNYEPLYREELQLYCGSGHPIFDLAPSDVDVERLMDVDYVARGYLREARETTSIANLRHAATVFHMEAVAMLILSGHFVGFLPSHYAWHWVSQDLMRSIRPDRLTHYAEFQLITRKGRDLPAPAQAFADKLRR
ncbi:LysR family transcriptional regulator [Pandoraea pnomenusa]|uniref:LysR family transcriptional regulator n=1 Tax=Pandoraea pnomenusa TaxID=93220 RepID=UPI0004375975|nr:LysR family transcriptional regulator [Pandoraea pnomenusa]AHN73072.1 LysR family transcriptional regulator [Pandoraea pnomenusa]ANC43394.1 LysR family transcriptional regulator [Pandoraea pnomenusa]